MNLYGDISPRTAAFVIVQLLVRAQPYLVLEKFLDMYVIPNNKTKTAKWRRYEALPLATTPLVEGVTPVGSNLTFTDYTAELSQYGDYVPLTDVIQDTHEDPVFVECQDLIAEQAAKTIESVRYGILNAGTNVFYANGTARSAVNTIYSLTMQRKIIRSLKRQNASPITKVTAAGAMYNTTPVEGGFVALIHPDLENDIRNITGFISVKNYARAPISEHELGAIESVRYLVSTMNGAWADAGGAKGTMVSTSGVKADVFSVLVLGQHCAGGVPLKGQNSIVPLVVNPRPVQGDPLGQRGSVGWKSMQTAVILNQFFMARGEVAATEL